MRELGDVVQPGDGHGVGPQEAGAGYFYHSVRTAAGVRKVDYGRGTAGHETAAEVEWRRQARWEAKQILAAERSGTGEADRLAAEVREWADVLLRAWLVLTGHHKHRGQWRRKRGQEAVARLVQFRSLAEGSMVG